VQRAGEVPAVLDGRIGGPYRTTQNNCSEASQYAGTGPIYWRSRSRGANTASVATLMRRDLLDTGAIMGHPLGSSLFCTSATRF
jgi:hypothetical protein